MEKTQKYKSFMESVRMLPKSKKAAYVLREVADLRYQEISMIMKLEVGTVSRYIKEARDLLADWGYRECSTGNFNREDISDSHKENLNFFEDLGFHVKKFSCPLQRLTQNLETALISLGFEILFKDSVNNILGTEPDIKSTIATLKKEAGVDILSILQMDEGELKNEVDSFCEKEGDKVKLLMAQDKRENKHELSFVIKEERKGQFQLIGIDPFACLEVEDSLNTIAIAQKLSKDLRLIMDSI